jgi:CBASS immunity sensor of nucleotide second messenger signals/TIR domain-containing protein
VVDPRGPVFISYRHSDGLELATALAWALRAAGVPAWHDRTDLPPGDTNRRLAEALDSGMSGAILLVTPEIQHSNVVREIELPALLELEKNQAFTFSIASTVERGPGKLDYAAPDRLLSQQPGTLQRIDQQPVKRSEDRADIARAQCRRRVQALRPAVEAAGGVLTLDLQTRIPPYAAHFDADLVLRLRPPRDGDRRPNRDGLDDLSHFLRHLPQLVAFAGAEQIRVRGGAHLSVAFALGGALPTTLLGRVEVVDTGGGVWALQGIAAAPADGDRLLEPVSPATGGETRGPVLVYIDLLPTRSDAAVEEFMDARPDSFAGWLHLRSTSPTNLDAECAATIIGEAAQAIRDLAGAHRTTDVHLLLRCPYPVALLLGRTLNTLRIHLYEWEDGPDDRGSAVDPRYVPSLVVRSGAGGSPIETITLPERARADPPTT